MRALSILRLLPKRIHVLHRLAAQGLEIWNHACRQRFTERLGGEETPVRV